MDRRGFMKIIGALPLIGPMLPKTVEAASPAPAPKDTVYSRTISLDTGLEDYKLIDAVILSVNLHPGQKGIFIRPFMEVRSKTWPEIVNLPDYWLRDSRLNIVVNGEIRQGPMRPDQIGEWPLVLDKPAHFEMRLNKIPSGCGVLEIQAGMVVYYLSWKTKG